MRSLMICIFVILQTSISLVFGKYEDFISDDYLDFDWHMAEFTIDNNLVRLRQFIIESPRRNPDYDFMVYREGNNTCHIIIGGRLDKIYKNLDCDKLKPIGPHLVRHGNKCTFHNETVAVPVENNICNADSESTAYFFNKFTKKCQPIWIRYYTPRSHPDLHSSAKECLKSVFQEKRLEGEYRLGKADDFNLLPVLIKFSRYSCSLFLNSESEFKVNDVECDSFLDSDEPFMERTSKKCTFKKGTVETVMPLDSCNTKMEQVEYFYDGFSKYCQPVWVAIKIDETEPKLSCDLENILMEQRNVTDYDHHIKQAPLLLMPNTHQTEQCILVYNKELDLKRHGVSCQLSAYESVLDRQNGMHCVYRNQSGSWKVDHSICNTKSEKAVFYYNSRSACIATWSAENLYRFPTTPTIFNSTEECIRAQMAKSFRLIPKARFDNWSVNSRVSENYLS